MKVPLATPEITPEDVEAVAQTMMSGWLTTGPNAKALETRLEKMTGRNRVLVGSSLTNLVPPLLSALPDFKTAAFPAWTFSSVAMEFRHMGKQVVLHDVEPDTFMLPVKKYAEQAIVPTHLAGNEYDLAGLRAKNGSKIIIDDAAHLEPRKLPEGSHATLYSFYATKPLCAGEGGAVAMHNVDWAKEVSASRLHGFSRDAFDRNTNPAAELYEIDRPGWKANMTDVAAALALSQIERLEEMRFKRRATLDYYARRLLNAGVEYLPHQPNSSAHLAMVILPKGLSRKMVRAALGEKGITTSIHFVPLYRFEFWAQELYGTTATEFMMSGRAKEKFPVCEEYGPRVLSLPLFSAMTFAQAQYVMDSLFEVMEDLGA